MAADLLRYRLGARLYVGPPSQLVRIEPPAPPQTATSGPGPLKLMANKASTTLRSLRPRRKIREKAGGRMPFRPHRWFRKPRKTEADKDNINEKGKERRGKRPRSFLLVVAAITVVVVATVPQAVLADGHEPWRDEIEFEMTELVEGASDIRREADRLRRAGRRNPASRHRPGHPGTGLRRPPGHVAALLEVGQPGRRGEHRLLPSPGRACPVLYLLVDGCAGAGRGIHGRARPDTVPAAGVEGELCDLRLASLGWTPETVSGVVESECVTHIQHPVELQTVAGHESVRETALMDAQVTAITGTVSAATGASLASVAFVLNDETSFTLPVGEDAAIHPVTVEVSLTASLSVPIPPLVRLTHHPERTERRTETVSLWRPGASDTASETVTVTHDDGTTTEHTVTAHAEVPGRTVRRNVTIDIVHPEHVKAEVVERSPVTAARDESLGLASVVGSDDPFAVLGLPEPEPEDPPAEQEPAGRTLGEWFRWLGWEWPW